MEEAETFHEEEEEEDLVVVVVGLMMMASSNSERICQLLKKAKERYHQKKIERAEMKILP
jgi:hypothetical protein